MDANRFSSRQLVFSSKVRTSSIARVYLTLCVVVPAVWAHDFYIGNGDVAALIAAIEAANSNGQANTIHLWSGSTYTLTTGYQGTGSGLPAIVSNLVVDGNNATIRVSASGVFRALLIESTGEVRLDAVTIRDGWAKNSDPDGAGIMNRGELTLTHSTVTANYAFSGNGGGIANFGKLTVIESTISDNFASHVGGGVANFGVATLTAVNASNNDAVENGGCIFNSGTLTLASSTISYGQAYVGGGIANLGTMSITGSAILSNTADYQGGGLYNYGTLSLTNNTISYNGTSGSQYSSGGGGVMNYASSANATVTNCTISANNDRYHYGDGIGNFGGTLVLTNTIVANHQTDVNGTYVDQGHNVVEDGVGLTDPTSMSGDPRLQVLGYYGGPTLNQPPFRSSRAIDAGDCAGGTVGVDQRGLLRPQGTACDIGAVELCHVDLDDNSWVDTRDVLAYLNLWTSGDGSADFNGDGTIDTLDLLVFLRAWAIGC